MKVEPPPSVAALRRFAQPRAPLEQCELCSLPLAEEHQHLVEPATRRIVCTCDPCAVLFGHGTDQRYRRVPRDGRLLADFQMDDFQWRGLQVPVSLAFVFHNSVAGQTVAVYPSPGGATEQVVESDAWQALVDSNSRLADLQPDVEALLIRRLRQPFEYFIAPIDHCYRLAGLIRTRWQGFAGGTAMWKEVEAFFDRLKRTYR